MNAAKLFFSLAITLLFIACTTEVISEYAPSGGSVVGGNSSSDGSNGNGGGGSSSGGGNSSSSGSGNKNVPANVTAAAVSSNSITISWNAVTGASLYYVYRAESSSGPYTQVGIVSQLSYTNSNLATATTFYYKVKAGDWQLSDPVSATTLLTAPSGVKAESLTSSSITITWNNFANATAYRIYRSGSYSGTYAEIDTSMSNSYTDATGLASNTEYYYKVSARNDTLEGDKSGYVSAKVLLHAPTGVTAAAVSSNSIAISWNAVTGASLYYVYRAESSSGPYTQIGIVSGLSYTSSNLATATTFYYKVKAGDGQLSEPVSATTLLTAPSGVKAESLTSSSITITWNNFANATAYRIYRSGSYSGTYAEIDTSMSNSYTDATGLASNVTYYYKISAYNNTLEGDKSGYVSAKVLLHAPANVTAEAVSSNSIAISWNAVTGASLYYVYRAESSSGPYTQVGIVSGLSYTSSNLATATTFYYKVKAGDGQLSEPVSATTQ